MSMQWRFPPSSGGQKSGLNDAGIAMFSDDAVKAMCREVLQNCVDARDPHSDGPVKVTFEVFSLPRDKFPGIDDLQKTIERCREYVRSYVRNDETKFAENGKAIFDSALRALAEPAIPFLRIRDENTTGLEGDDDDNESAWDRLIRTQGAPSMHGEGGGSYGVGQRAPFAASPLRTVFYGTMRDGGFAFIGKSIWSSWRDDADNWRQNIGWWGRVDGHLVRAVTELDDSLPEEFHRQTKGTDILIPGFPEIDWSGAVLDVLLQHFFVAIEQGTLVVTLPHGGSELELTAETIAEALESRIRAREAVARSKKDRDDIAKTLGWTRHYLRALQEPVNGEPFVEENKDLGRIRLFVARDPKAPSRTLFVRSPRIRVYDRPFPVLGGHASVFLCDDPKGNMVLRSFEGPQHDSWTKRVPGRDRVMNAVSSFVKKSLESLAGFDSETEQDIEELARFLPEELPAGGDASTGMPNAVRSKNRSAEESGAVLPRPGTKKAQKRKKPVSKPVAAESAEDEADAGDDDLGGSGGGEHHEGTGGDAPGEGTNPGDGAGPFGADGKGRRRLRDGDLRFRSWFDAGAGATVLTLQAGRKGVADLQFLAVGEDNRPLDPNIVEVTDTLTNERFSVESARIRGMTFDGKQRRVLRLVTSPPRRLALSIGVNNEP